MGHRNSPWRAHAAAALVDRAPDWSAMLATRMMGKVARLELPAPVTRAAISAYARYFDVDLRDVDQEHRQGGFASFDEFFTRSLAEHARPIAPDSSIVVSPCDGFVREVVRVEKHGEVIAKGHSFTVGDLLADTTLADRFVGGLQSTIYLHPRDYHRVHTPCAGAVKTVTAIPGRLLPVTDASLERCPTLFSLNERLVHSLETPMGAVAVVMIAAFGVGHMSCAYVESEAHPTQVVQQELHPSVKVEKGDELGVFHLGSTVVLFVEEGFESVVEAGPIQFGMPLLRATGSKAKL